MSVDQPSCREDIVTFNYVVFGGVSGTQILYFAWGNGQHLNALPQETGLGFTKGLLKTHSLGCFQTTGLNAQVSLFYNAVVIPGATLTIPTGIFLSVQVVNNLDFELNAPFTVGGNVAFAFPPLAGTLFLLDHEIITSVIIR